MAAVKAHAEAIRNELRPTPAAGNIMPGRGIRAEAMRQLKEVERTAADPRVRMGFRAVRELLEQLLGPCDE